MLKILPTILVSILLIISCKTDLNNDNISSDEVFSNSDSLTILIFKKERKIEIWDGKDEYKIKDSIYFESTNNIPIGFYELKENTNNSNLELQFLDLRLKKRFQQIGFENFKIDTPEDSSALILVSETDLLKLLPEKNTKVYILPNDFRKSGQLEPCFACPHWMTEVYAQLELSLRPFQ